MLCICSATPTTAGRYAMEGFGFDAGCQVPHPDYFNHQKLLRFSRKLAVYRLKHSPSMTTGYDRKLHARSPECPEFNPFSDFLIRRFPDPNNYCQARENKPAYHTVDMISVLHEC
jgi:hypothetical protein